MNRLIKFRGWTGKRMMAWESMLKLHVHTVFLMSQPEIKLMQYTGLKDKNGVEIYEGDIVVYYLDDHNGDKECYREMVEWGVCGFRLTLPTSFYEVIGNIYENPELIK